MVNQYLLKFSVLPFYRFKANSHSKINLFQAGSFLLFRNNKAIIWVVHGSEKIFLLYDIIKADI